MICSSFLLLSMYILFPCHRRLNMYFSTIVYTGSITRNLSSSSISLTPTPLCRGTIRQYVEQVLRLWTVLVFPPPLEFSCAHIYSEILPTHNSYKILLYTVKNLQLFKLRIKVIPWLRLVFNLNVNNILVHYHSKVRGHVFVC